MRYDGLTPRAIFCNFIDDNEPPLLFKPEGAAKRVENLINLMITLSNHEFELEFDESR
jgi:hypothetical protein